MTCHWCRWPHATALIVENRPEWLCTACRGLVARYGVANVRLP